MDNASKRVITISVDTEADLLDNAKNKIDSLKGIHYLQEVCAKTGIIPIYLLSYEMATKEEAISIIKPYLDRNECEIGHHLHIWTCPPFETVNRHDVDEKWLNGYQSEMAKITLRRKLDNLHKEIEKNYGITPKVHRAERWAVDHNTFEWLEENNYEIDTSVAPLISFKEQIGVQAEFPYDGKKATERPYRPSKDNFLKPGKENNSYKLWEIPVTTYEGDLMAKLNLRGQSKIRNFLWKHNYAPCPALPLRPSFSIPDSVFEKAVNALYESDRKIFLGMLHSNELSVGGSPKSETEELLKGIKRRLEYILQKAKENGIEGCKMTDLPNYLS
jgi:hypothetical protein